MANTQNYIFNRKLFKKAVDGFNKSTIENLEDKIQILATMKPNYLLLILILFVSHTAFGADLLSEISKECEEQKDKYYKIEVSAKSISRHKVKINIQTNIPLPVELMASVDFKNQKPDDTYIGYSKKIVVKKSSQNFVLNTANENLPSGNYITEVAFYPLWGAEKGNSKAAKIKNTICGSSEILLKGTGQAVEDVKRKNEMQSWIMENVWFDADWNKNTFTNKLGRYEELTVSNMNPAIIKVYYFLKADMTIFVNVYKNKTVTYKMGKTSAM